MDYIKNNKMNPSKEQTTNLLNQLAKEKTQAMTRAEAKCRKLNMGRVPYFTGLAMKAMNVIFWNAIKRRKEGAKVQIEYLKKVAKKVEFYGNLSKEVLTLDIIKVKVKKAEKAYMEIKQKACECRESFITTLINKSEGKSKTIIKEIKKREEMSNQWRIWNVVSGNKISAAITAVETTSNGNKVKVNNREEVEREIMICLSKRFSLTNNNSIMKKNYIENRLPCRERRRRGHIKRKHSKDIKR